VSSEQELILASCCLSPMRRNSVFKVLKSQKVGRHPGGHSLKSILEVGDAGVKVRQVEGEKKVEYRQHKGDGLKREMK